MTMMIIIVNRKENKKNAILAIIFSPTNSYETLILNVIKVLLKIITINAIIASQIPICTLILIYLLVRYMYVFFFSFKEE